MTGVSKLILEAAGTAGMLSAEVAQAEQSTPDRGKQKVMIESAVEGPRGATKALGKVAGKGGIGGLVGLVVSLARQSQAFTASTSAIFQILGSFLDITFAPFMPLIFKVFKYVASFLPFYVSMIEVLTKDVSTAFNWIKEQIPDWARKAVKPDARMGMMAALGFMVGGPIGALVAVALDEAVDFVLDDIEEKLTDDINEIKDDGFVDWFKEDTKNVLDIFGGGGDSTKVTSDEGTKKATGSEYATGALSLAPVIPVTTQTTFGMAFQQADFQKTLVNAPGPGAGMGSSMLATGATFDIDPVAAHTRMLNNDAIVNRGQQSIHTLHRSKTYQTIVNTHSNYVSMFSSATKPGITASDIAPARTNFGSKGF